MHFNFNKIINSISAGRTTLVKHVYTINVMFVNTYKRECTYQKKRTIYV